MNTQHQGGILPSLFYELFSESLGIKTPTTDQEKADFWVKYHEGTDLYIPEDVPPADLIPNHEFAWLVEHQIQSNDPKMVERIKKEHDLWKKERSQTK